MMIFPIRNAGMRDILGDSRMNQKKIDRTNHPPSLADLICSSPWEGLMKEILKFRDRRDWAQFHDPIPY